ncbi:MAG: hypothetical protein RLY70_2235 [Planctomycetota bacterium]
MIPVRCVRAPQTHPSESPANRPLGVLFMAASPQVPGRAPLDFEAEEGRILQGDAASQSVQVLVEESGNLDELKQLWQSLASHEYLDVLHLSGHAGRASTEPVFEFETLEGELDTVTAGRLNEALPRRPRLAFLSGCSTGLALGTDNSQSFAQRLVREGWPAVLGWGNSIADSQATLAATTLYGHLESGVPLGTALRLTWRKLREESQTKSWHLLRLHCFQSIPAGLVTARSTPGREPPKKLTESEFLDPGGKRCKVADRLKFVGRRRLLQSSIRLLDNPPAGQVGLMLYGQGGRGKSSAAARLCDRLRTRFSRVVVVGKLDETAVINAICAILPKSMRFAGTRVELEKHLRDYRIPLANRLEIALSEAPNLELFNLLFVLDDFEQNQPGEESGDVTLEPQAASLLQLLCETCERLGRGRVLITGRYALPEGYHRWLHHEHVLPLTRTERRKQLSRLAPHKLDKNATALLPEVDKAADGNPRLYEWLYDVLACPGLDHAGLLKKLQEKEHDFQEKILLEFLVASLPKAGSEALSRLLVFEEPIPESLACELWVATMGESLLSAAFEQLLGRCVALGLVDRYREKGRDDVRAVRQLTRGNPPFIEPVSSETARILAQRALPQLEDLWWNSGACTEPLALELMRLAGLAVDTPRLVKFARKLASSMIYDHRAVECLELLDPILHATVRDPLLLVHGARAAEQVGDGDRSDQWMREAAGSIEQLPADERTIVMFHKARRLVRVGEPGQALTLLREELIPMFDSLETVREKAVTMGQIADILQARGELDEALRIRREESLPVYERLGDVRSKAVTMGKIADILQARGELDEALRIRREEELPVYERLGDVQLIVVGRVKLAFNLLQRGDAADFPEIIALFHSSLSDAERCRLAEADQIRDLFHRLLGRNA